MDVTFYFCNRTFRILLGSAGRLPLTMMQVQGDLSGVFRRPNFFSSELIYFLFPSFPEGHNLNYYYLFEFKIALAAWVSPDTIGD